MSEEARKRGQEFAKFLQSLPEAERIQGNAQHREFQAHFELEGAFFATRLLPRLNPTALAYIGC
jgi:hypothetical protein